MKPSKKTKSEIIEAIIGIPFFCGCLEIAFFETFYIFLFIAIVFVLLIVFNQNKKK